MFSHLSISCELGLQMLLNQNSLQLVAHCINLLSYIAYTYTGAFKLPLNPRMQEVINSETKLLKVWNHGLELNFIQPEKIKRKDKFKGIPETNTFKLQNKAAEFPYPESCGEYSTRQMFTKAYCIKQELYSLVFGNICVFGITLLPFPLQILYSLLFLFVSALLPGLMHMYSALHSFQCKICGQH